MEDLKTANGGTELAYRELYKRLPSDLLDKFQIYSSRINSPLKEDKVRIIWQQDLPGDPASEHLKNEGWRRFHKLVFVTNWQAQAFINYYNIPPSRTVVIQNAIEPIPEHEKPNTGIIKLGYWSTPHRGLEILVPVFKKLCEKYDNIELTVMSSFAIYGWGERDTPYKSLFDDCISDDKIYYLGAVPHEKLVEELKDIHILAYPSIWQETSCMTLMEALSAKMIAVHPNLGALPETAANWSNQYQFNEDKNAHASIFYDALDATIALFNDNNYKQLLSDRLTEQKRYVDLFYSWKKRELEWKAFLESMQNQPTAIDEPKQFFEYKVR